MVGHDDECRPARPHLADPLRDALDRIDVETGVDLVEEDTGWREELHLKYLQFAALTAGESYEVTVEDGRIESEPREQG